MGNFKFCLIKPWRYTFIGYLCAIVWNISESIDRNLFGKFTPWAFGKITDCKGRIKLIKVEAANITEIGYDKQRKIVYLRFKNGMLYIYRNVPPDEFENLKNAPSLGSYINRKFKNVYPYSRME